MADAARRGATGPTPSTALTPLPPVRYNAGDVPVSLATSLNITGAASQSGTPSQPAAVRVEQITRRFPGVLANDRITFEAREGAIHGVVGENGAGKSTLLRILYGRLRPDSGRIFVHGEDVTARLRSPRDAIALGVALVSQHFSLVSTLSLVENIVLGAEPTGPGSLLNLGSAAARLEEIKERLGLSRLDLARRAGAAGVAARQAAEILKALYRSARVLLLDEPTAVLAPAEAEALYGLLRELTLQGVTVILVTHKLDEAMAHCETITVLREGRNAGEFAAREISPAEILLRMMGRGAPVSLSSEEPGPAQEPDGSPRPESAGAPILDVRRLTVRRTGGPGLRDVSIAVRAREIVGIAGVDGSGQQELVEAIEGLRRPQSGQVYLNDIDITHAGVRARQRAGVAYIPEDRQRDGLVMDFTVAENWLLGHERNRDWGGGAWIRHHVVRTQAQTMIERYGVRIGAAGAETRMRALSGGNQQKVMVARALEARPRLLIACQPTRGLDSAAMRAIRADLLSLRASGASILLVSVDLEEILTLADRIVVLCQGAVSGTLDARSASRDTVGALMTGLARQPA